MKKIANWIFQHPFLFFLVLTLAFYFDTRAAGFVTDFLGWQFCFQHDDFWQILHASNRGIKSFYHFTHLQMWILTRLFGDSQWAWWIVFSSLHAFNAILIFHFFKKMSNIVSFKNDLEIYFLVSLLFLLSPIQTEVLVWRASYHYLTGFAMQWLFLNSLLKYLETSDKKYVIWANIIFFLSLFSLEFFLFTPFVAIGILIFYKLCKSADALFLNQLRNAALRFVGIPFVFILGYFVTYKLTYGVWIAHYGGKSYANLFSFSTVSTFGKYLIKHLALVRYAPNGIKIFDILGGSLGFVGIVILLFLTLLFLGLFYFKRLGNALKVSIFSFFTGILLLMPVLTWYFSVVGLVENDRYGYFASPFLFLFVLVLLHRLPKTAMVSIGFLYLSFHIFYLLETTNLWFLSGKTFSNLIKKYERSKESDEILILNLPDAMRGVPMFRIYRYGSAFKDAYTSSFLPTKIDSAQKIYDVMRYGMTNGDNSVHVIVDSPDTIRVKFNQIGTWWVSPVWGENDYENESFKVKTNWDSYTLTLKPTTNRRKLLFQVTDHWKTVDRTKLGEQW